MGARAVLTKSWRGQILEVDMKKIALAAVLSAAASTAFAGGHGSKYAEPVIEPEIIVEETRKSSAGIVVPIMLLVLIAAAVAAN